MSQFIKNLDKWVYDVDADWTLTLTDGWELGVDLPGNVAIKRNGYYIEDLELSSTDLHSLYKALQTLEEVE